jgi:hypothetical protein
MERPRSLCFESALVGLGKTYSVIRVKTIEMVVPADEDSTLSVPPS